MGGKCVKIIRLPCDLKDKVERLARSNGLTCAELIRLSIETKLPDCEVARPPTAMPTHEDPKRHKIDGN
jgi:hypothetical protein